MRYILNILRRHSLDRTTSIFLRTSTAGLHCVTAQIGCSGWTFSCCQYKTITCSFCSEHSEEKRRCSDSINVTAWRREPEWKSVTLVFVSESEYYNHDNNNNNEYWNVAPRVVSTREDFSSGHSLHVCEGWSWFERPRVLSDCFVFLYFWHISAFLLFKLGPVRAALLQFTPPSPVCVCAEASSPHRVCRVRLSLVSVDRLRL